MICLRKQTPGRCLEWKEAGPTDSFTAETKGRGGISHPRLQNLAPTNQRSYGTVACWVRFLPLK